MTIYLRQSTASQEVALGFFVDSTDGNTEETGLTIAAADIRLHKAGATTLATPAAGATHISNGIYYWVADATDTNTIGSMAVYCHPTGALATKVECVVLDETVYDTLLGTTALATSANVTASENNVRAFIESQRGHHTACGAIFYVQKGGSDANPGTYALPFLTIQAALNACTANAHDTVIVMGKTGNSPSVFSEALTMSKAYVFLRGMDRDTKVTTAGAASSTITISANGCEVSGLWINNTGAGATEGVEVASGADFAWIHHTFIDGAATGVNIVAGANCTVENNRINDCATAGVNVAQGGAVGLHSRILTNHIDGAATGINFAGSDSAESVARYNNISQCTTGVVIAAGASFVQVTDNRFAGNTTDYTNAGTSCNVSWNILSTSATGVVNANVQQLLGTAWLTPAVAGTPDVNVKTVTTGAITAASIAADAITDAKVASDVTIASVTGAVGSVTGAVGSVTGNVGGNVVGSVGSVVGAVGSVTGAVGSVTGNVGGSVASVTANVNADVVKISGSTLAADNLQESAEVIGTLTCAAGGNTTTVIASALAPTSSVNDQFNGRVMIFKGNVTAALAGQATTITDYVHATQTMTVVALTTAPASGDLAVIL